MSKKLYDGQDINDLVTEDVNHEETFYKGGPGSGQRGHTTPASGRHPATEASAGKTQGTGGMGDRARIRREAQDAIIAANDKKIADHPVKTSKNSPTGG